MTPAETETKARRVLALRLFYALRAHYPDKNVALSIVPRDAADDAGDLTPPKTAG
jgi:diadenosine tetraphosphate (Ap4A) HIT family hydrolase